MFQVEEISNMKKTLNIFIYFLAIVGVTLSALPLVIFFRPSILELVGIEEVSSKLYSCMTYKDLTLIEQFKKREITLEEAKETANSRNDIAEAYTECLRDTFGYHTVWVNENNFIIYD